MILKIFVQRHFRNVFLIPIIIIVLNKNVMCSELRIVSDSEVIGVINEDLCWKQFNNVQEQANIGEMWARRVLDSWGSLPPNGHLFGHYVDLGNFDECLSQDLNTQDDTSLSFKPQYCIASYPLDRVYTTTQRRDDDGVMARLFVESRIITEIGVGVCVPDTCKMSTLNEIFKQLTFNRTNNEISKDMFSEALCTKAEEKKFDAAAISAIAIFGVIGLLMLSSTIYDVYISKTNGPRNDILLSFSIITNARKLFAVQNISPKGTIDCLNGIRCLSIVWIVYGHTLQMFMFMPLLNYEDLWKLLSEYYTMVIISGPIAVDSFFLLSGLLVTLHIYRKIDKSGHFTISEILKSYVHRYLRLFPVLAAAILFAATLYKYVGSGPYWNIISGILEAPCKSYWWLSLLYLQNYVNNSAMCLGHTWYLSTDMQLYILSPLILIPLKRWGKKFVGVIILLIFASCTYIFVIMYIYGYNIRLLGEHPTGDNDKNVMLYYGTHTRAPSWLIGVILGHILYVMSKKKVHISKIPIIIGWITSLVVIAAIVFGPYKAQQQFAVTPKIESAFFEALYRVSFALAVAWIIFACQQGYGGYINSFLSSPLWQPFSRLSYAIYIVHLIVVVTLIGIARTDSYLSTFTAIHFFWGHFGVTFSIAIVLVLAFEMPMFTLEKYILGEKPAKAPTMQPTLPIGSVATLRSEISDVQDIATVVK